MQPALFQSTSSLRRRLILPFFLTTLTSLPTYLSAYTCTSPSSTSINNMLILVGAPGSGKSYFARNLLTSTSPTGKTYVRINQDELKTRKKCERICRSTLDDGNIPIIDRCNFDIDQRSHFLKIAKEYPGTDVDCVVFQYGRDALVERCQKRVGHESVTSKEAAKVVSMIYGRISPPSQKKSAEGFRSITTVRSFEESNEVVQNILSGKDITARSKDYAAVKKAAKGSAAASGKKRSASTMQDFFQVKKQKTDGSNLKQAINVDDVIDITGDSDDAKPASKPVASSSSAAATTATKAKKSKTGSGHPYRIYCDLDGVLADFDAGVGAIFNGKKADDVPPKKLWPAINNANEFYLNLQLMSDGLELWQALVQAYQSHPETTLDILTGVPTTKRFRQEKFDWCVKKLGPSLPEGVTCNHVDMAGKEGRQNAHLLVSGRRKDGKVNVITCWSKKKHMESGKGAVLIDDRQKLQEDWEQKGGIFVLHTDTATTLQKLRNIGIF